ncbi:class I SAM-dependent DNA methyltransferase [soil metagenome]
MAKGGTTKGNGNGANLGFEQTLWAAADKLRGHLDAAEYKHVVLGLIFLKYISDAFEARRQQLLSEVAHGADPEDPDEYRAENVFWVPPEARWERLQASAKDHASIGQMLDKAMDAIEHENPSLRGVLPRDYSKPSLDKRRLGELVDLISTICFDADAHKAQDILGRTYEYFLGQFAGREGKKGGEFYTPRSVVRLLVEMIEPYAGRVYDPCCGSSGMFVQSEEFIRAHGGRIGDLSIFGQESNPTTWKLARMNLAIRGIDANLGPEAADSFHTDLHPDLRADFILANPPFNMSDWGQPQLRDDLRWKYGIPPAGNANYAWVQHIVHHLAPSGIAGFVLANGSMSSMQSGEGEIRKSLGEADLVDCMVALPAQLFYGSGIPVCLWFLARDRSGAPTKGAKPMRDRRGSTLFIDARNAGTLVDRTHRELTNADIARIAGTYHAWRGEEGADAYADVPGFSRSAPLGEIREHGHVLTPGRYVGAAVADEDAEPFEAKLARLTAELDEQFAESDRLTVAIRGSVARLRYPVAKEEQL